MNIKIRDKKIAQKIVIFYYFYYQYFLYKSIFIAVLTVGFVDF